MACPNPNCNGYCGQCPCPAASSSPAGGEAPEHYRIAVQWSEEDGEYVATSPDLPRLSALAPSRADAVREFEDAASVAIAALRADGQLPAPVLPVEAPEGEGEFSPDGYPLTDEANARFNATMDMHRDIQRLRHRLAAAESERDEARRNAEYAARANAANHEEWQKAEALLQEARTVSNRFVVRADAAEFALAASRRQLQAVQQAVEGLTGWAFNITDMEMAPFSSGPFVRRSDVLALFTPASPSSEATE